MRKFRFLIFIFLILGFDRCEYRRKIADEKSISKSNTIDINPVGIHFFKIILDTITVSELTPQLLIKTKWYSVPFENCISIYSFNEDGKGENYNCELEDMSEIFYKIQNDTLLIEEYNIPHVDNPEQRRIMTRLDKYVYNGIALTMIGSTMYNLIGKQWTPSIKTVIEYLPENNNSARQAAK